MNKLGYILLLLSSTIYADDGSYGIEYGTSSTKIRVSDIGIVSAAKVLGLPIKTTEDLNSYYYSVHYLTQSNKKDGWQFEFSISDFGSYSATADIDYKKDIDVTKFLLITPNDISLLIPTSSTHIELLGSANIKVKIKGISASSIYVRPTGWEDLTISTRMGLMMLNVDIVGNYSYTATGQYIPDTLGASSFYEHREQTEKINKNVIVPVTGMIFNYRYDDNWSYAVDTKILGLIGTPASIFTISLQLTKKL